ncbi:MAG: HAMP domain-containing sensor histidine kinase [Pseudomonadota bacterium]
MTLEYHIHSQNIPLLKTLQNQREAAWLWDPQQGIILWANISGLAFWDEPDLIRLKKRHFDKSMPGLQRIVDLANQNVSKTGVTDTFLFWTKKGTQTVFCHCSALYLKNGLYGLVLSVQPEPTASAEEIAQASVIPSYHTSSEDKGVLEEIASMIKNPGSMSADISSHSDEPEKPREQSRLSSETTTGFLAKVSHELRTPLNSILGFAELMKTEHFGSFKNQKYKDCSNTIYESALHALSVVNDLLDVTKIEAGHFSSSLVKVNLNLTIENCLQALQPQISKKRLIVRQSLSPNLRDVLFDERNLKQVLFNVVTNAIKFTRQGGQIIVSTISLKDKTLKLRIIDTGIGMSEADIAIALQPFRQLESAAYENSEGTGLGLPLAKAMVEANGCEFCLSSELNKGTQVDITFPEIKNA